MLSLREMTSQNTDLDHISTNWMPRAIALADLNTSTSNLRINQLVYATAGDESVREEAKLNMITFIGHITENYDAYDALREDGLALNLVSEGEQELFEEFDQQWESYQDLSFTFLELAETEDTDAAISLIREEGQAVFSTIQNTLNELVGVNKDDAVGAASRARQTFESTSGLVKWTVGFTTVLSILIAVLLIRVVTVPLRQLVHAVDAVAGGNLDVQLNLRSRDEIGHLAHAFNGMTIGLREARERVQREAALIAEAAELRAKAKEAEAKALKAENERKSYELEEARRLQLSMLPSSLPQVPEVDLAVYLETATEVGGDYYDFIAKENEALTLAIGDATGHGLHAGTMVTATKSLFKAMASDMEPVQFLKTANRALKQMGFSKMYMAMTVARLWDNRMLVAGAGMPYTLIYRHETKQVESIVLKGMPLGGFDGFPYQQKEVTLHNGDVVVFLSDGITERFNDDKEMYGEERLKRALIEGASKDSDELTHYLRSQVTIWGGSYPQEDDETLIVLKIGGMSYV